MGIGELFRRRKFKADPNGDPFDTAIAGLDAPGTYVDEHGRTRELSEEQKANMRADLERARDQARRSSGGDAA